MTTPIVDMRGIYKSFGPVQALVDVHLRLMPGEVLGLVGDNSAGKSTLMKISPAPTSATRAISSSMGLRCIQEPAREP